MFTETGAITKRTGYTTLISTPVVTGHPVTSIFDYKKNDGTSFLLVTSSPTIKKLNTAGNNWDTLLSTMTAVTGTDFYDYCVYPASGSICIITNGKDKIQKYLGAANTTDLGTGTDPDDWRPNTAKYCETWDYRLWLANITDANGGVTDTVVPNRVRYSSVLGSTSIEGAGAWPPLFYFDIADTNVTGLAKLIDSNDINDYRQKLIVFGPNSISVIGGTYSSSTNYNLKKIVDGKGTLSNRTIKTADNILIFQDKSGDVYSFDGANVKLLSEKIQTTINGLNKQYLNIACAAVYPKYHQYWLAVPDGAATTNNLVLVYDYLSGAWTKYTEINASDFAIADFSSIQYLYSADNTSGGYVFKQDTGGSNNGSSIFSYYKTKDFCILSPGQSKQFDSAYVTVLQTANNYSLDMGCNFDFNKEADYRNIEFGLGGSTWQVRGTSQAWFDVAMSDNGQYQSAVVQDGDIHGSSDYGVTWSTRGALKKNFEGISMSDDGMFQTAVVFDGYIYASSNYGVTWATGTLSALWRDIDISAQGNYRTAVGNSGVYVSSNSGVNWTNRTPVASSWIAISMSEDGKYQTAISNVAGLIYTSSDFGVTWIKRTSPATNLVAIDMSKSGRLQTIVSDGQEITGSTNYGETWLVKNKSGRFYGIALSGDGRFQTTGDELNGYIYTSSDYGVTWVRRGYPAQWYGVAMSGDGKYQTFVSYNGHIFCSSDYGGELYWAVTTKKISLNKSGNFVKFTFGVTGTTSFTLYGFTIKYFPIELR